MTLPHLIRPTSGARVQIDVTPASAAWRYLSFQVLALKAGETCHHATGGSEVALVPLNGRATVTLPPQNFTLARDSVFTGKPHVLYAPPGCELTVQAGTDFEYSMGSAPAEGRYPVRLFRPDEMKTELRGGGTALRQVNHILAAPLPAERLILFEVYVPGGAWSGWPPHCHDGYRGSPYLEEVYYFRFTPEYGFGIHRNYRRDTDFDEVWAVRHGDTVLITQGFHPSAATPGSNMYFLNYLAGDLLDEARATPPLDDADFAWMRTDWDGHRMALPIERDSGGAP
jgi:5-deoxy-glucuronate isomerase